MRRISQKIVNIIADNRSAKRQPGNENKLKYKPLVKVINFDGNNIINRVKVSQQSCEKQHLLFMCELDVSVCITPRLSRRNIVRFAPLAYVFVSGHLVRTSQGVTHSGTTPTQVRLTTEFQEPVMRMAPKRVVFRKTKVLLMNSSSLLSTTDMGFV